MEKRKSLTCIVCPLGCSMEVIVEGECVKSISGNSCKRGFDYAESECINPTRILTTTVRVKNGLYPVVPVKTDRPIPKNLLFKCMELINSLELTAPVNSGDLIACDILHTGANIVATRNIVSRGSVNGKEVHFSTGSRYHQLKSSNF